MRMAILRPLDILPDNSIPGISLPLIPTALPVSGIPAEDWAVPELITFILRNHHGYVTDALPRIMRLLERVVTEYGLEHPELEDVFVTFHSLTIQFLTQMRKEEVMLFPVIRELARTHANQLEWACFPFEPIQALIDDIEADHSMIAEGLAAIRRLTHNFTVPEKVCRHYRQLYQWLEVFEKDVYLHEHLENDILFPKAIALENAMR
jgi:regulator of cell morphogenesis and NO signaling